MHLAVDTFRHLRALHLTPANIADRANVATLTATVQAELGETVTLVGLPLVAVTTLMLQQAFSLPDSS